MNQRICSGLLLMTLLIKSHTVLGQFWFDVALSGSAGSSFLTNSEIYQDTRIDIAPKVSSNFSLKIGLNFTETESIVLDAGVINRNFHLIQKDLPNQGTLEQHMNFGYSGFRFLPMYRHTKDGSYVEIGPEFGNIKTQYFRDDANGQISNNTLFGSKSLRGAIGFGGYLLGNERVTLVAGMRLLYDFQDLRSEEAQQEKFPYQNYTDQSNSPFKAFDIQLSLELNVSLGFLVRSSCGRRQLLFKW